MTSIKDYKKSTWRPPLKPRIPDTFDVVGVQDSPMQNYIQVEGRTHWYDETRTLFTHSRFTV